MNSLLTSVIDAQIKKKKRTIVGKTTTRPRLRVHDEHGGKPYVVNVDVGDDELMIDVAVTQGNNELRYAAVGSPVTLEKIAGHWTVTGFSKTMPGTFHRVPVDIPEFTFGIPEYGTDPAEDLTITVRALTYGELAVYGTYGQGDTPYGLIGKFKGGELIEVYA